ncbi:MAG: hypothetical protein AABX96_00980 [Nanoarchaeota archaeon]
MRYQSRRYRYSLEIPDGWIRRRRKPFSLIIGSNVTYESLDRNGDISISAGKLEGEELSFKHGRKLLLDDFSEALKRMPPSIKFEQIIEIPWYSNPFDLREENTLYYSYAGSEVCGRLISSFHKGIGYLIQSRVRTGSNYSDTLDKVIKSFKFEARESMARAL